MMNKRSLLTKYYPENIKNYIVNDREVVEVFSSKEKEYNNLRNNLGITDLSNYGIFKITGEDAEQFLDKLSTKDIVYLNIGQLSECCFLDADAKIIAFVNVCKFDAYFLVIIPWESAEEAYEWMVENQSDFNDIQIEDLHQEYGILSFEGPKSGSFIKNYFDFDVDILPLRTFSDIQWKERDMTIIRNGFSGEFGYMLISEMGTLEALFNDLIDNGHVDKLCGSNAMDITMLEVRQPNMRMEKREFGSIFEMCQQWLIQYDKEDYIGHEAVISGFQNGIDKKVVGFSVSAEKTDFYNADVLIENEIIGRVLFSRYSYKLKQTIGLVLIDKRFAASGLTLMLKKGDVNLEMQTISSPYLRPDSWDIISNIEE